MKVKLLKAAHRDRRGDIIDILTHVPVDAVTLITCRKGSIRGNHYHRKTVQYTYLVSGHMKYLTSKPGRRATARVLKAGHLVVSPAGENHAFQALSDSVILSLSSGPRRGHDFEKDTFRLEQSLV